MPIKPPIFDLPKIAPVPPCQSRPIATITPFEGPAITLSMIKATELAKPFCDHSLWFDYDGGLHVSLMFFMENFPTNVYGIPYLNGSCSDGRPDSCKIIRGLGSLDPSHLVDLLSREAAKVQTRDEYPQWRSIYTRIVNYLELLSDVEELSTSVPWGSFSEFYSSDLWKSTLRVAKAIEPQNTKQDLADVYRSLVYATDARWYGFGA